MTHISNNVQELHDKLQSNYNHSIELEGQLSCTKPELLNCDKNLETVSAINKNSDISLLESSKKSIMGNVLKYKKEHCNDFKNDGAASTSVFRYDSHNNATMQKDPPIVLVNDSTLDMQSEKYNVEYIKDASFDKKSNFNHLNELAFSVIDTDITESVKSSETETKIDFDDTKFFLNRDSAYGSSSESGSNVQSEHLGADLSSQKQEVLNTLNHTGQSSTKILCTNSNNISESITIANKWSSSSSIASDSAAEFHGCNDDSDNNSLSFMQLVNTPIKKNLSSSTFSLRSSLSLESEDDFTSGDDSTQRPKLGRRDSQVKAQRGWKKIRQMVAWSPFMQSFKKKYPWVQLAGHAGNFQPGEDGCILKKYVEREATCLQGLTSDSSLQNFAPTYHGVVYLSDEKYTRMQDLLLPFDNPSLMDCKMGIRTYLENELIQAREKPRLRQDMYQKMIEISPDEPTEEERKLQAVTKPRYMQWREQVSSTSNLGFRIEGIKKSSKVPSKDYKLTKTAEQVKEAFKYFIEDNTNVLEKYISRLKSLRNTLENSDFFHSHEAIGSSLLFVHDETGLANVWMIDFGKTSRLPDNLKVDHRSEWKEGNREDGYLFGVDNMIILFEKIFNDLQSQNEMSTPMPPCNVDIIVTAPSPTVSRKQTLRRQVAEASTDEFCPLQSSTRP